VTSSRFAPGRSALNELLAALRDLDVQGPEPGVACAGQPKRRAVAKGAIHLGPHAANQPERLLEEVERAAATSPA
jgi:hypothetical protein